MGFLFEMHIDKTHAHGEADQAGDQQAHDGHGTAAQCLALDVFSKVHADFTTLDFNARIRLR